MSPIDAPTFTESASSSSNKKAKTTQEEQQKILSEFEALTLFIQRAPILSPSHPAVQAALEGISKERQKLQRDWKLQEKFKQQQEGRNLHLPQQQQEIGSSEPLEGDWDASLVTSQNHEASLSSSSMNQNNDNDWQDLAAMDEEEDNSEKAAANAVGSQQSGTFGVILAQQAVLTISQARIRVSSPLQAIAVVLHAALQTGALGFVGTTSSFASSSVKLFAEPIRELPRDQFLPQDFWEQTRDAEANGVTLRYRKDGLGAMLLRVEQYTAELNESSNNHGKADFVSCMRVSMLPEVGSSDHEQRWLEFALDRHFNMESFQKALAQAGSDSKAEPALHYKALADLMTNFCSTFDVGPVIDSDGKMEENERNNDGSNPPNIGVTASEALPSNRDGQQDPSPSIPAHRFPATIDQAFPMLHQGGGQFDGDLLPHLDSIIGRGGHGRPDLPNTGPGNLMGPDHPMWTTGGGAPLHRIGQIGGPGTMQPRYDPIGPPFGPTDPNNDDFDVDPLRVPTRRRDPPGGSGIPNNSLLQPPNMRNNNNIFPGGNMYM